MYLNRFLPYYLDSTGEAFETVFRKQLGVSKIGKAFESLFEVSDSDAKALYTLENTKFRYSVVKVSKNKAPKPAEVAQTDKDKPEATEPENIETVSIEPDPAAPVTATTIFAKWSKGEDVGPLLKEHNLSQRVTSNLNLSQLDKVLDGDATTDELLMLAKLDAKTPFPPNVIEKANSYYLVKLDAKIDSPVPDEKL